MLDQVNKQSVGQIEVLNPVAELPPEAQKIRLAARPATLDGKRVGLYWNYKPGGKEALERVGEEILSRFKNVSVAVYAAPRPVPKAVLDKIKNQCDVVVGSTADCGGCTSYLIHDLVQFEKLGLPSVAIVSAGFEKDAESSARAFGMPGLPYGVVEHTLTSRTPQQARTDVEAALDDLIQGITKVSGADSRREEAAASGGATKTNGIEARRADPEIFTGAHTYDAWENMNSTFMERGWSDGFPLVAPTPEKVEAMLRAVTKDPLEVLGRFAPGNGLVTIEKLAINCVMAGCQPEHLPILVTAVDAMLQAPESQFPLRTIALSTGPHTPMLLINGPIVKKLGINNGVCTLGPGKPSRVNTVLGRALRLIMMNVGHAYPGKGDMDTIGTPLKYSFCLAENEDASPWPAFHEERGFRKDQSTVTVLGAIDISHVKDYNTQADELLNSWACAAARPRGIEFDTRIEVKRHDKLMMIAPDHARVLVQESYTKSGIRQFIAANALAPIRWVNSELRNQSSSMAPEWRWTLKADQNMLISAVPDPHSIHIVVVGGPTGKSDYVRLFGQPTDTKEITCASR